MTDVFSKYVWVEPLKHKTCTELVSAIKCILSRHNNRIPYCLQHDKGTEFLGSQFKEFLQPNNIFLRTVCNPDIKAAIVKRFSRTLKDRMWWYFTFKNTKFYIDVMQDLVTDYNAAKHSSLKITPCQVNFENAQRVRSYIKNRFKPTSRLPKYDVGDLVRVSSIALKRLI